MRLDARRASRKAALLRSTTYQALGAFCTKVVFSTISAGLLLGGCSMDPGMNAYRQGEYAVALREFQKEDDPAGAFAIGVMHYKGEGVDRDPREASKWFRRAAGLGHAGARFNLGLIYARGDGVPKDRQEAVRWFRTAAGQGDAKAQVYLGGMYARGEGVGKDRSEAARWFRQAAEQGNVEAQVYLGSMHLRGDGVKKDREEAAAWLGKAAAQGSARAREILKQVSEKKVTAGE